MKPKNLRSALGMGLLLAIGSAVAWGLISCWGVMIVESMRTREYVYQDLNYFRSGAMLIVEHSNNYNHQQKYTDLDGNDATATGQQLMKDRQQTHGTHFEFRSPDAKRFERWTDRIGTLRDRKSPPAFWFFIRNPDGATGYFVAYDSLSKQRLGFMTANGWQSELPTPLQLFPQRPMAHQSIYSLIGGMNQHYQTEPSEPAVWEPNAEDEILFITDAGIQKIDTHDQKLSTFVEGKDFKAVRSDVWVNPDSKASANIQAATNEHLYVWDSEGTLLHQFPLPKAPERGHRSVNLVRFAAGDFVIADQRWASPVSHVILTWFDAAGKQTKTKEITLKRGGEPPNRLTATLGVCAIVPAWVTSLVTAAVILPLGDLEDHKVNTYFEGLAHGVRDTWPAIVGVLVLSLLLAAWCWRRQRQLHQESTATWAWPVFVVIFGMPGLIGYLYHRRWPALLPCPSCQQPAPRHSESCGSCQQPFPLPTPNGLEVFAR